MEVERIRNSKLNTMPLLRITTNQTIAPETQSHVLKTLSAEIATLLGKSESYVMTAWLPEAKMTFGGQIVPTAYLELDSIDLIAEQAKQLSHLACSIIAENTEISPNSIYIKFYDAPRAFWGWDGKTFG